MAARTQQQLADALEISRKTLLQWMDRPDWKWQRRGPWDAKAQRDIAQWRVLTLQEDRAEQGGSPRDDSHAPADLATIARLKKAKLAADVKYQTEHAKHEQLKHEILGGHYIRRDLVDGALGGLAALFVQVCDELEMRKPDLGPLLDDYRRRLCDRADYELRRVEEVSTEMAAGIAAKSRGSAGGGGRGRPGRTS
ncbi:MAG: hypothetical protein AAGI68_12100 [Planctomycetota bacterium]